VKLTGAPLKRFLLDKLAEHPQVQAVVVENNQGGDLWVEVLNGLPVKLVTYGSHESKEVRFARALDLCQKNRVTFGRIIPALEDQLLGFPRLANDDLLDAACAGMLRLLTPKLVQKDGTMTPR
jgi:phage terminase large subunit-like protein